ncbi:MAG: hypothetical protein ACTSO9_20620 [Candidatus Helarchaeota archaeon]
MELSSKFSSFIQDYRFKMVPLPIPVAIATILLRQEIWFNGIGIGLIIASITLHGICPLDNYMEGKLDNLPKFAVVMLLASLFIIPISIGITQWLWLTPQANLTEILFSVGELSLCICLMLVGFFLTEITEYFGRNTATERIENFGDLLYYGGPIFFIAHVWSIFLPGLFLCIGIDSIHKIAHYETVNETISWICYFLFPVTVPLFFNLMEIFILTILAIPIFGFYSYLKPVYTKWLAIHSISFSFVITIALVLQLIGIPCPLWFEAVPVIH